MSRCRVCQREWGSGLRHCPEDGTPLELESDRTISAPGSAAAPAVQEVDPDELAPGTAVGEYVVEAKIGEGGMGQVYAAQHPLIGKKAAIKVISRALCTDRTAVERFVQEARAVNQIGHPNIVDVFNFGTLRDGRSYFVMEWMQGETLGDRIARGGLSLGEVAMILDQIADALEAAHEKGIVHRDLKPDNAFLVRLRSRQIVKLLDFGIAKLAGNSDQRVQRTRTGTMMGTPAYISPEQARGRNVDHRTDIYSLGCMAFELICGRLPFDADNPMDMIASHLSTPPPPASSVWPEIPPALDTLLLTMMDKDPARRPPLSVVRAHFQEFGGTIAGRAVDGASPSSMMARQQTPLPAPSRAMTPPPAPSIVSAAPVEAPKPGRKKLIIGALAAALAGGVVVVIIATRGYDKPKAAVTQADTTQPATTPAPPPVTPATPTAPTAPAADTQAPPAPPQTGTLDITLTPASAHLEIDGQPAPQDLHAVTLKPGDHTLEAGAAGYKPLQRKIAVAAGETQPIALKLERGAGKPSKPPATTVKPPPNKGTKDRKDTDYTIDPFHPRGK